MNSAEQNVSAEGHGKTHVWSRQAGAVDAPKSRHGVRQVPLSPGQAQRLWKLLATEPDDALVFSDDDGKPLKRSYLYRVVRATGERVGIDCT